METFYFWSVSFLLIISSWKSLNPPRPIHHWWCFGDHKNIPLISPDVGNIIDRQAQLPVLCIPSTLHVHMDALPVSCSHPVAAILTQTCETWGLFNRSFGWRFCTDVVEPILALCHIAWSSFLPSLLRMSGLKVLSASLVPFLILAAVLLSKSLGMSKLLLMSTSQRTQTNIPTVQNSAWWTNDGFSSPSKCTHWWWSAQLASQLCLCGL